MDTQQAAAAYDDFSARPRPQISMDGLGQVIDVVWDAEGYHHPKAAPARYLDLSYFDKASMHQPPERT